MAQRSYTNRMTENIQSQSPKVRQCANCSKNGKFRKCSGCKIAHYCGPVCQRSAWPYHKTECNSQQEIVRVLAGHDIKAHRGQRMVELTMDTIEFFQKNIDQVGGRHKMSFNALWKWIDESDLDATIPLPESVKSLPVNKRLGFFVNLLQACDVNPGSYGKYPNFLGLRIFGNTLYNKVWRICTRMLTSDEQTLLTAVLIKKEISDWGRQQYKTAGL